MSLSLFLPSQQKVQIFMHNYALSFVKNCIIHFLEGNITVTALQILNLNPCPPGQGLFGLPLT